MSIYKRGDVWWMDVRMGGSRKRVRKSTGCRDEVQARIIEQAAVARRSGGEDGTDGAAPRTPEERERRGTDGASPRTPEGREEWVFPWRATHPNGQRPKDGDHFFAEVLAKAGIEEKEGERISFHCLRHTFVTRLSEAGVAQDVRMRLAGHTNAATSNAYTHDDASARAAIEALE